MGRKRKDLIDKSTSLILRIDNKTLFNLCDKLKIEYDPNGIILDDDVKNKLKVEIIKILHNYVK